MKKSLISLLTILMISSFSLSSVNAEFDFEGNDWEDTATEQTVEDTNDTTDDTDTNTDAEEVSISNMDVSFDDDTIPADGKTETKIYIKVTDDEDNSLSDKDVDLKIEVSDDNGEVKEIKYDKDLEVFEVTYVAGKTAGQVSFDIIAESKANPDVKLEQLEEFTLSEYEEKEEPKKDVEKVLAELENTENAEANIDEATNDEVAEGANIISSQVMDENRVKITFDRELFLPEDPLSLVSIKTTDEEPKEIEISNIMLSDDKNSLIVLTKDNLEKKPYLVTINEVIDWETKKKVSVVNGELTVTGLNELFILMVWIILFFGVSLMRRKNNS